MTEVSKIIAAAGMAVALAHAVASPAVADSAAEFCLFANEAISIGVPLPRAAARLRAGGLRIVAVGSSSTTGLWVLSLDSTYPQVMRRELAGLRPGARGGHADGLKQLIVSGVRTLKGDGADVILMDLQYAPMILYTSQHEVMQANIAEAAREERVGLFSRFSL